ncbi:MAG: hypothetical protein ABSB95_15155, partial [Dissulfurispiraceae bacterium]
MKKKNRNKKIKIALAPPSPVSIRPWTKNSFIHISGLVLIIIAVYGGTLNAPFQWDENYFIANNPIVRDFHYFSNPSDAKAFSLFYGGLMTRYVGYLTFALNYRVNGLSVTGYHIVNISVHIANSILVYFLILLTFRTPFFRGQGSGGRGQEAEADSQRLDQSLAPCPLPLDPKLVAFFSSLIFAVHPMQTEAVTYVFQRFASLAAFFYLLSLVMYIKSRLKAVNSEWVNGESKTKKYYFTIFAWYFLSLFFAVCAMKTKENAFTLPFIITLYEFCFFSSPSPRVLLSRRLLYLAPILLTLCIIPLTLIGLTGTHGPDPALYGAKVFHRDEY